MGECVCKKCGYVSGRKARFFSPVRMVHFSSGFKNVSGDSTAFYVCDYTLTGAEHKLKRFSFDGKEKENPVAFSLFDAERLVKAEIWEEIDAVTAQRLIPGCIFQWDDHDGVELETGRPTVRIAPENEMLWRNPLQELGKKCCGTKLGECTGSANRSSRPVRLWLGKKGVDRGKIRVTTPGSEMNTCFYDELFSDGKGGFEIRR